MDARATRPTRDVALFLGSAGGVSGKGSGASPSQDALNLVRWSLARGFLDPRRDKLVAVHVSELNPLATSRTRVTHELVTPSEFPEWMPPALAHAFGRFAARGGGKGAAAALVESPLAPAEALVRFVSGALADAEKRHSPRLLAFHQRAFAFASDGEISGNVETDTARRSTQTETEPTSPFPVDLWPAEDVAPAARREEGKKNAFDLVLVGASDKSGFGFEALSRAVLGSVSRYVLENSPVPVLVVRARDARRASGFGNDAAYAPARARQRKERKRFTRNVKDDDDSSDPRGHARSSSFPGNWRMRVDDDAEDAIAHDAVDAGFDRERLTLNADDDAASSPSRGSFSYDHETRVRDARFPPPPLVGNAVCVAHDGGEDGIALVRWTLRTIFGSGDRALFIVHVASGTSPDSLAKAMEATPVAAALKTSDDDVARFVAAFRDEDPPPSTAPASSTLVVSSFVSKKQKRRGFGPFLPPGSGENVNDKWGLGALLLAASERSADVLVVGSRRLRRRLVAGGAARTCARLAPCAVLAVPADALEPFRRR